MHPIAVPRVIVVIEALGCGVTKARLFGASAFCFP